jgi:hypothetical protein
MHSAPLRISLVRAPDDLAIGSTKLQLIFGKCRAFLHLRGVMVSTPMSYGEAEMAAGCYIGEFIVSLVQAIEPPVEIVLDAWFEGRSDRIVRLTVGDAEVVAQSTKEAVAFLRCARQLREAPYACDEVRL